MYFACLWDSFPCFDPQFSSRIPAVPVLCLCFYFWETLQIICRNQTFLPYPIPLCYHQNHGAFATWEITGHAHCIGDSFSFLVSISNFPFSNPALRPVSYVSTPWRLYQTSFSFLWILSVPLSPLPCVSSQYLETGTTQNHRWPYLAAIQKHSVPGNPKPPHITKFKEVNNNQRKKHLHTNRKDQYKHLESQSFQT